MIACSGPRQPWNSQIAYSASILSDRCPRDRKVGLVNGRKNPLFLVFRQFGRCRRFRTLDASALPWQSPGFVGGEGGNGFQPPLGNRLDGWLQPGWELLHLQVGAA